MGASSVRMLETVKLIVIVAANRMKMSNRVAAGGPEGPLT